MFVSTQDHSLERSEAQITGTHHRYPLSFFAYHKFHSPERRCRPYYYAPFVQNIYNFLMIWRLATLPDTSAWHCGQKRGRRSEYPI